MALSTKMEARVATVLVAHELRPIVSKLGETLWGCAMCDDFTTFTEGNRHGIAQAEHQAPFVIRVLAGR